MANAALKRGIVGDRQLLAVQMFDIARLTSHAVPVVPGALIAVAGIGPKADSNGSGKTSFLAAVSVLLGDPQWRLDVNGGKYAAGVLFKPDAAGIDPAQQIPAASHGYVVGVFGGPADPISTALTVWVRIASASPYVQARWISGVHVADAEQDGDRALQADSLWQAIGSSATLSARRMSDELYGAAPRCLSYLDTPLRPVVPSLLSQQMTEMEPQDIGESLIALSGLKGLLDDEEHQRGAALTQTHRLAEAIEADRVDRIREDDDLARVGTRDAARAALADGARYWRLYLARQYLDVLQRDEKARAAIDQCSLRHAAALADVRAAEQSHRELGARTDLAEREAELRQIWDEARESTIAAREVRAGLSTEKGLLIQERPNLLVKVTGWSGDGQEVTQAALANAIEQRVAAMNARSAAVQEVADAEHHLDRAISGRSGAGGTAAELLQDQAQADCSSLLDLIELNAEARPAWEPRLWPWRDAVVVNPADAEAVRAVLDRLPGVQVIYSDPLNASGAAPTGVHSGVPLHQFLSTLESRSEFSPNPASVYDDGLGLTVSGGFEDPITGYEAGVRQARKALATAKSRLRAADALVVEANAKHSLAFAADQASRAAARLAYIDNREAALDTAIAKADARIVDAMQNERQLESDYLLAKTDLDSHASQVAMAKLELQSARKEESELQRHVTDANDARGRLALDDWQSAWGGDRDEATRLIADSGAEGALRPASLRRRASEQLHEALKLYGIDDRPEDLQQAAALRERFSDEGIVTAPTVLYEAVASPLRVRLDGHTDRDLVIAARIAELRNRRQQTLESLRVETASTTARLEALQDMLERHIEGVLIRVGNALDRLDTARGRYGAELQLQSVRPTGGGEWQWRVTPRWRRARNGGMVPYREVANGAQVKAFAVQLVLAALLAGPDPQGHILMLDELGNSLGDVNRRDILRMLKEVAEVQEITVFGTCQDSVLSDAADFCRELLWFTHATDSDAYNQPTRVWGYDQNAGRVELTADWLRAGRLDV